MNAFLKKSRRSGCLDNLRANLRKQKKSPGLWLLIRRLAIGVSLVVMVAATVIFFAPRAETQTRPPSGEEIIRRVDDNITAGNKIMTARMIIHLRRASRTVEFKSYVQGTEKAFTEYLAPPRERGTKMLKLGNQLWMYSPWTERTILISGHMLRQSVMGSDLSYEDMMEDPKLLNSYTAQVVGEETIRLGEGLRAEQAGDKRNAPYSMMTSRARTDAGHCPEGGLSKESAGQPPRKNEIATEELFQTASPGPNTRREDFSVDTMVGKINPGDAAGTEEHAWNEDKEARLELFGADPVSKGLKLPGESRHEGTGTRGPADTYAKSNAGTTGPPAEQNGAQAGVVEEGSEVRCWVLELLARKEDVAYPRRKLWVDKERFVAVREELYARGGTLLKKVEVLRLRKFGSRWVPDRAVFKDMLKAGEGTEFVIDSIEFDARIPDYIFTRAALK